MFIAMSAFLLGLAWESKSFSMYDTGFFIHRIKRLVVVYYPFLIGMFIFLFFEDYSVSIKDVFMHVAFLPWFDKLPGFGHLWFVTMIVICYAASNLMTRLYPMYKMSDYKRAIFAVGVILVVLLQYIMDSIHFPGYMILYLFLYLMIFIYAKAIVYRFKSMTLLTLAGGVLLINSISLYLYYYGIYSNMTISVWLGILCATSLFGLLLKMLWTIPENKVITFISTISFEIYLVHHVFCFGKYSIYKYVASGFGGFFLILCISVVLAYILHFISGKIKFLVF